MAEIINLRQARKARARTEAQAAAATNRARHGATKAERARTAQDTARTARTLDGARLDGDTDGKTREPG